MRPERSGRFTTPLRSARLRPFAILVSCTLLFRGALVAQRGITLDLGGASVRYADTLSTSALTFSPALRLETARLSFQANSTVSQLGTGGWTAQGALGAAGFTPARGSFTGELGGSLGGSAHRDGTRTGQALLHARAHLSGRARGAWVGAGAGGAWDGAVWRTVRQAELGGWQRSAQSVFSLGLTPIIVDDSIEYADAQLDAVWQTRALALSVGGGYRMGDDLPTLGGSDRVWGGVSALAWLTPWAGVVASAGTYPVDFTQNFPGGRYVTVALRLRAPVRSSADDVAALPVTGSAEPHTGVIESFDIQSLGAGRYLLRVRAARALRVELHADFTDWQPVSFVRSSSAGLWTATLTLAPGSHQMNVRIDGGPWLVPPGLATVADEFGGTVGILVVTR